MQVCDRTNKRGNKRGKRESSREWLQCVNYCYCFILLKYVSRVQNELKRTHHLFIYFVYFALTTLQVMQVRPTLIPTAKTTKIKKVQFPSHSRLVCTSLPNTLHCSESRSGPKLKSRGDDSASAAYRRLRRAAVQAEEAGLTYCFCLLCTQPPFPPQTLPIRSSGSICQPVHHQPQLQDFTFYLFILLLLLCLSSIKTRKKGILCKKKFG